MSYEDRWQGLVLAGVHRWNRDSFEELLPRPLMQVAHSPLISYTLHWFYTGGVRQVTICANSVSGTMRRLLADGSQLGMALGYYEDRMPRGPAGCVRDAGGPGEAGALVVAEGTMIPRIDLPALLECHQRTGAALTVVVETDASGALLIPAGIYVFERRVLGHIRETGYQDIKEVLIPRLHDLGEKVVTYAASPSLRVTDAETYLQANDWALERIARRGDPIVGYRRSGEALIHVSASVAGDGRLIGPVLVGPRTRVGPRATLVGPTTLGADCVLEEGAVVCRSVLWDHGRVGRGGFIDRCVIAGGAELEDGVRLYRTAYAPARGSGGPTAPRTSLSAAGAPERAPAPTAA